jgi:cobyrinic acid a,c-diamide synthase
MIRHLPRLAVGSLELSARAPACDADPIIWGLLAALHELGRPIAHFHSQSCLAPHDAARSLTGTGSRHLDSWAMSRSTCARTLLRASEQAELAVLSGSFAPDPRTCQKPAVGGSSLAQLCDWLDLPRIGVIDVAHLDPCQLTVRPPHIDAVLLDRVADARDAIVWRTNLEALWNVPVLGWLDQVPTLRGLCSTLPAGRDPSPELCTALGRRLLGNLRTDLLATLADRAGLVELPADDLTYELAGGPLRIAVAYDEECCGYFPDTLDLLEEAGAELCDFSPLRSGSIPDGADIVYFGGGHPERTPPALATNFCLQQSLCAFAAAGGRVYAEGSGVAYLAREMLLPGGRRVPMAGLLPVRARFIEDPPPPEPIEVTFHTSCWMVEQGTTVRGYSTPEWELEPTGSVVSLAREVRHRRDLLARGNVIGSRVMLNLAANEHLMRRFMQPAGVLAPVRRRR